MSSAEGLAIQRTKEHVGVILKEQLERVKRISQAATPLDYSKLPHITVGVAGGDGIGPIISRETMRVLSFLLSTEVSSGKVVLKEIDGLTLENRVRQLKSVPDDVLMQLRACNVLLKGPTTTPEIGSGVPNLESANVQIRKIFDLYANVRPVKVPREGINWTFYRENTEGEYILGSEGIMVNPDLALDFKVITTYGSERIIRAAFDYARKTGSNKVTVVTKANIIKTTDGVFLEAAKKVAREFPEVTWDSWYIDAFCAKLIDPKRRRDFKVVVLPNLYGDIVTDEAAEFQGGVGTAGSANIGDRYAMFEAIHGSAPRMIEEGRGEFADPSSLIRAAAMLLEHIGFKAKAETLNHALDICCQFEAKFKITGRAGGATAAQFTDYVIETTRAADLGSRWRTYIDREVGNAS